MGIAKLFRTIMKGKSNSLTINPIHQQVNGIFFILSGIPIDDTGGGARCTQIALELLGRGYLVVFINKFPKYESVELNLSISHPYLITCNLTSFSFETFVHQYDALLKQKPVGILIEFPLNEFLPIIRRLNQLGAVTIYDLLDDWNTSLGSSWYTVEREREIIDASRALVATAPALYLRLQKMSGRPVDLLPNAVNLNLFDPYRAYPRPDDLPPAEWNAIFFGALWGEWFDWPLLIEVAKAYPSANVVVIGDYRGQCPVSLKNLIFPGLKPQKDLPSYLAHSSVAILPWKVNKITLATSPIKIYEYLAMKKPVVAPDLPLLKDIPFVLRSQDPEEFVRNVERARHVVVSGDELDRFLKQNSWQARVDRLLEILNKYS